MGVAQEKKGKRSSVNALANGAIPAICGVLAWLIPEQATLFALMAAASIASAAADTIAGEFGNIYGSKYINAISFKPGPRGEDGIISLEGTLFGVAAAAIAGIIYSSISSGLSWQVILAITVAGSIGNYIDSLLGASLQRWGYMNNDTVNLANTAAGALAVWPLAIWLL